MTHRPLFALVLSSLALLWLPSCLFERTSARVSDDLLRSLSWDVVEPVAWATAEAERAAEVLKAAGEATRSGKEELRQAEVEHRVVTDGVDRSNAALVAALRSGNISAARDATARYKEMLEVADTARVGVVLAKRELEHAELFELLALERTRFAAARLDLVRADALTGERLSPEDTPALDDLRAEVFFRDGEVEVANQRLSAARVRLESARTAYEVALLDARRRAEAEAEQAARERELRRPPPLR